MARQAPNPIDVQDFQFKLHCYLKIFNNPDASIFVKPCSLLACASQYGLIFVGTNTSSFQVIHISSIEKYSADGYPRRVVALPSSPKHLAVNCDGSKLVVVVEQGNCDTALCYDVTSFTKQEIRIIQQIYLSNKPNVNVLEICWNPTVSNIFTACKDDGSLGVYELQEAIVDINELPVEAQVTCMSWSPKGKQLAVGSRNGKITQYKPDLKAMKVVNAPPLEGFPHVIALQWISNYQFIAVYKAPNVDSNACLLVIDSPKVGEAVYTNYEDICYGYGSAQSARFYTIHQPIWNILMVASSNGIEVGVMGCQGEQWTQWILTDTARAELPLTASKEESFPIGLAFDTGVTEPVIWGESSFPPAPYLLILSHEGFLCCFRAMNLKAGMHDICQKPMALTDTSGINQFVLSTEVKETSHVVAPKPQPVVPIVPEIIKPVVSETIKPVAPETISAAKQPLKTESSFKPAPIPVVSSITQNNKFSTYDVLSPVISPVVTVSPLQLNETNLIQKEADMLIANLIQEECDMLEIELKSLLHKASLLKVDLGKDAEAVELVQKTDTLQDFLSEVVETNTAQTAEVSALKQATIQTWAWYEDARFRLAQTRDVTLESLLRLQQLDPVSQRYISEIKQMSYYLDSQIKQAGQVLDGQWSDFQDKCKIIVRTKIPTMETIYQAMVRHSIIIEKQKYILKDIANRNRVLRSSLSGPSVVMSLNNADLLEKSLKRLQLEPEQQFFETRYEMVVQKQKCFTQAKISKLASVLKSRDITDVKINKQQFSNITSNLQTLLQSSPRIKKSIETSLIGAGLSPITTKPAATWGSTFIQSTPKPGTVGTHKTSFEQKAVTAELPTTNLQSKFVHTLPQTNITSAFVPTTQLAFSFTNKSVSMSTTATPSMSTFTFGATPTKSLEANLTTNITTISPAAHNKKGLLTANEDEKIKPITTSVTPTFGTVTPAPKSTFDFSVSPKTTSSSPFNFTPSTTFGSKTVTSTSAFNFAPTGSSPSTTAVASSTTTTNWLFKNAENSSAAGTGFVFGKSPTTGTSVPLFTKSVDVFGTTAKSSLENSSKIPNIFSQDSTAPASSVNSFSETNIQSNTLQSGDLFTQNTSSISSPTSFSTSTGVGFSFVTPKTTAANIATVVSSTPSTVVIEIRSTPSSATTVSSSSLGSGVSIFPVSSTGTGSINTNASSPSYTNLFTFTSTASNLLSDKTSTSSGNNSDSKFSFGGSGIVGTTTATDNKISPISSTGASSEAFKVGGTQSIFGNSASNVTSPINFGASTPSTTQSLFETPSKAQESTPTVGSTFVTNTTTSSFSFSNAVTSSKNIFGSDAITTGGSIFGGTSTNINNTNIFNSTTAASGSIFGSTLTTAATNNLFNSVTTTAGGSIFGAASTTTTTSLFGSPVTSPTTSSIFGTQINSPASIFGASVSSSSVFATPTNTTATAFGTPTNTTASVFGTSINTTASVFGSGTPSDTTTSVFGASPFTNTGSIFSSTTKSSQFNTPPSGSIFGQQSAFGGAPVFGSTAATSTNTFGSSNPAFGTSQSTNGVFGSTGFSKPFSSTSTSNTASFGFGDLNMGSNSSPFSGQTSNPFAKSFATEQKPFGGGSLFGSPSTTTTPIFGTQNTTNTSAFGGGSSTFGFSSSPGFGSTFGQTSSFGQQNVFGSPSQLGSFSTGNQSVAQGGFGGFTEQNQKSGFGGAPVFGGSPSNFGAAPSFGGGSVFNTSFGSPNKVFGDSPNTAGTFGSPSQMQNPTFANLATQNTVGFNALAQQSPQPQSPQTSFSGGSSFSTWR